MSTTKTAKKYKLTSPAYDMIYVDSVDTLHNEVIDFLHERGLTADGGTFKDVIDIYGAEYDISFLSTLTVGDYLLVHYTGDGPAKVYVTENPDDFEEM